MTTVYNLPFLRSYFEARLEAGNPVVSPLLQAAASLVRESPCCRQLQAYAADLRKNDTDPAYQLALAVRLLSDNGVSDLIAPAMAATYLDQEGRSRLADVFQGGVSVIPLFDPQWIGMALSQNDPRTGRPPALVDILAAVDRQARDWGRLGSGGIVPMESGALSTVGDFDTTMMLLLQKAHARRLRGKKDETEPPLFVGLATRPGSPVDALRFTAGTSKRRLPLSELVCGVTAFPIEVCGTRDVRGQFELLFWTPRGSEMVGSFDEAMARVLGRGALVVYDPKTFSETGLDMDEHSARVLSRTGRGDVTTAFIAGYTGAKDVFGKKFLWQETTKTHGLCLGAGVTHMERGRRWAAQMTGISFESGRKKVIQGCEVYVYQSEPGDLERPLIIWVYNDPHLRKAQRLFSIYKNVYSGILGQKLFEEVWRRLRHADGQISQEGMRAVVRDVERLYREWVGKYREEIRDLLVRVEKVPRRKCVILEPSLQDASGSWGLKEGGIDKLFQLVRALFFTPYSNGEVNGDLVVNATRAFQSQIGEIFSTRNPQAGVCLAAGYEALRYRLVDTQFALMPPGVTFEGLNTALILDKRLSPEQIAVLPRGVRDYLIAAKAARNPVALPPNVRQALANLAGLLAAIASGQTPSPRMVRALTHRVVKMREVEDTMRWQHVQLPLVTEVVLAIRIHLETAIQTMEAYGLQHARLADPLIQQLRAMIANMDLLTTLLRERNDRKEMSPQELLAVLHAIKSLITEGDRLYLAGETMENVMRDLRGRMEMLFAYLLDIHEFPYPRGQMAFLNESQRKNLQAKLAARSASTQAAVANG